MHRVISILLAIGQHRLLKHFSRLYKDKGLPIALADLQECLLRDICPKVGGFSEDTLDADVRAIAKEFNDMQWKFSPVILNIEAIDLRDQHILPIYDKLALFTDEKGRDLHKGGTAELFQVKVLEEFLAPALREKIPNSTYEDKYGSVRECQTAVESNQLIRQLGIQISRQDFQARVRV